MNLKDILLVGSQFIGNDASKIGKVKKAFDMAQKYSKEPNGIQKAISEIGISKDQAENAMTQLQTNAKIKSAVESLSPGITSYLRQISNQVRFSGDTKSPIQDSFDQPSVNNLSSLQDRLNKL